MKTISLNKSLEFPSFELKIFQNSLLGVGMKFFVDSQGGDPSTLFVHVRTCTCVLCSTWCSELRRARKATLALPSQRRITWPWSQFQRPKSHGTVNERYRNQQGTCPKSYSKLRMIKIRKKSVATGSTSGVLPWSCRGLAIMMRSWSSKVYVSNTNRFFYLASRSRPRHQPLCVSFFTDFLASSRIQQNFRNPEFRQQDYKFYFVFSQKCIYSCM